MKYLNAWLCAIVLIAFAVAPVAAEVDLERPSLAHPDGSAALELADGSAALELAGTADLIDPLTGTWDGQGQTAAILAGSQQRALRGASGIAGRADELAVPIGDAEVSPGRRRTPGPELRILRAIRWHSR